MTTDSPTDLYTLLPAQGEPLPIIANLPHSGLKVPPHIAQHFTQTQLATLPNSDWHLQPLYSFLPSLGISVLQANYSRYVVDLNRAIKPPLFGSFWSAVIAEQTAFKKAIYTQRPTKAEVQSRIENFYTPYHQILTGLLNDAIARYGYVYLLDLHSFMGLITDDVCLGNGNGATCQEKTLTTAADCLAQQEYQVVKNKVFTGGYITRHYGQNPKIEALQIELRYPVYLPDDQLEISTIPTWQGPKFDQAQTKLQTAISQFVQQII
ncbi:MAG: N-formylglutamate amidohydrolase [Cyanobacteria bacterium J06632_3]